MSLKNYLVKGSDSNAEMHCDFRPEEVELLYNRVKEIGVKQYLSFVREHLPDILRYISLSPSQRQQRKWISYPDALLLRLAALQISDATLSLQSELEPISEVVDHGSYRLFHALVASALAPLLLDWPFCAFPFQGYDNPFVS